MDTLKGFLVYATLQLLTRQARGHGYLAVPGARNSAWRLGFPNPVQYTDNQLNCGGFWVQHGENEGRCGVCGDPWNAENTGDYVYPGVFANNIITATYTKGQVIDVTVKITSNHKGTFVFRIGDIGSGEITQEKLIYTLSHLDGATEWRIPDQYPWDFTEVFRLRLPADLVCQQCVLQWWYKCGNNWGDQQETFVNCADVSISSDGSVLTTATSPPTTASTTRSTVAISQSTTRVTTTAPTTASTTTTATTTTAPTTASTTTTRTTTPAPTTASTTTTATTTTTAPPTTAATTTARTTTTAPTTASTTTTVATTVTTTTTKATTTPQTTSSTTSARPTTTLPTTAATTTTRPTTTASTTTASPTTRSTATTPRPSSVTCVGTEAKRATYPTVDEFCRQNCPLGYCPTDWCVCDGNPVPNDGCYAFGARTGLHYDYLCRRTCMSSRGCPLDRCSSACASLYQGK